MHHTFLKEEKCKFLDGFLFRFFIFLLNEAVRTSTHNLCFCFNALLNNFQRNYIYLMFHNLKILISTSEHLITQSVLSTITIGGRLLVNR